MCVPAQRGDKVLFALDHLESDGTQDAVLREVGLVDADNMQVESFDVLVDDDDGYRGLGEAIPLSQETPVIEVGESAAVRVIVRLVDPTVPGDAAAFDVEYSDEDGRGTDVVRTTVSMQVVPQGEVCW